MLMSAKNHELVKSLNWLATGNPDVKDAQRSMRDAAQAITDLEETTTSLQGSLVDCNAKRMEQDTDYIMPLYAWAKHHGFDLEHLVTMNPGKNCTELFLETIEKALVESLKLQSHYAGLLNQYDQEGQRLQFSTIRAWIQRLQELKKGTKQ